MEKLLGRNVNRRKPFRRFQFLIWSIFLWGLISCVPSDEQPADSRPHILFAISDDQSWPHASAYGSDFVKTPAFDRIADEGILFTRAFVTSPGCAPSRASIVTGRYPWQNGPSGNHGGFWNPDLEPFPFLLEASGYQVGYTGKGVGPFYWAVSGLERNPAGNEYNQYKTEVPYDGIRKTDYARNFQAFLQEWDTTKPFFFWYGASEPHRRYTVGSGLQEGKSLDKVAVPDFLPDSDSVRIDLTDYAVEIEYFDRHLGEMVALLEEINLLDKTLIIVTSDNGMPFPAAKANCYEYGIHVPLAVRWGKEIQHPGRVEDTRVSLVDLWPTLAPIAGVAIPANQPVAGTSWMPVFENKVADTSELATRGVYAARERHSSSRWLTLGYPQRALRTDDFLYILNFHPERWPAGAPKKYGPDSSLVPGYHDLDWSMETGLSNRYMIQHRNEDHVAPLYRHAMGKRPRHQLYNVTKDPSCLHNLAEQPEMARTLKALEVQLKGYLAKTGDPRLTGDPMAFEKQPRFSHMRYFPVADWAKDLAADSVEKWMTLAQIDHSYARRPESIREGKMVTDRWVLYQDGEHWKLYDRTTSDSVDVSDQHGHVTGQLLHAYRYWMNK